MTSLLVGLSALLPTASAQSARLVEGTPEFESCLSNPSCEESFYSFLTESMVEQGFTFQDLSPTSSAVNNPREGLYVGGQLATFPLTGERANLSGKTENTSYSPVLPRLHAGYRRSAEGERSFGAALSALPPIPVGGASALVASLELSAAQAKGAHRVGGELDVSYARARAPIVASEEQYERRDEFNNPDNLDPAVYEAVCLPLPNGCIDTFRHISPELRAAWSWSPHPLVGVYAKVGVAWVTERLYVQYDDTLWGVDFVQTSQHLGLTITPIERLQLGLGASISPELGGANSDSVPLLFKGVGSLSFGF